MGEIFSAGRKTSSAANEELAISGKKHDIVKKNVARKNIARSFFKAEEKGGDNRKEGWFIGVGPVWKVGGATNTEAVSALF